MARASRLTRLVDAAAVALVLVGALAGAGRLLGAADLDTGAGDWHAHAWRIGELGRYGLAPWTHEWAGGLPPWSAYQFVPHGVVWAATWLADTSVTRAMAVSVGLLTVWIPLSLYLVLRLAGVRSLPALIGALLALLLDSRRQPLANFSELWGLALAPPLLWGAWRWSGQRGGYALAVAAGLAVYVHPLAMVTAVTGILAAAVIGSVASLVQVWAATARVNPLAGGWRLGTQVRRLLLLAIAVVRSFAILLLQLGLVAGAAGFFLLPALRSARPAYEHPYFAAPEFERLLLRLAMDSFAPGWAWWLALAALAALSVLPWGWARRLGWRWPVSSRHLAWLREGGTLSYVLRQRRARQDLLPVAQAESAGVARTLADTPGNQSRCDLVATAERQRAAWFLLCTAAIIAALVLSSQAGWGPRVYRNAQLPRLVSVLPLLASAAFALALDRPNATMRWRVALAGAAAVLSVAALGKDWRAVLPEPVAEASPRSSFTRWLLAQRELGSPGSRVAAPPEVVADASAFAPGRAWYTGSYSGREWSILSGPLALYMGGYGAPETRGAFLTAMAVDLALVAPGARPPILDPRDWQPAEWRVVARFGDADLLRLPWPAPYAVTVPRGSETGLEVPDLSFLTVADAYVRDELTRRWAALLRGPAADPVTVRIRQQRGAVDFELRNLRPGRVLLVSENWDRAWRAEAGGSRLPVRRAGPNLLAIDLDGAPSPVHSDVHVRLTHGYSREWWLGLVAVLATLPVVALAVYWGPHWEARRGRGP